MRDTILFGDCRETLKEFDEKARCCVTSPPYYGLRDYGGEDKQIGLEQSPEEYIQEMVNVFRLVRDNLTDDGTLWLNIGDSYYNYKSGTGEYAKQSFSKSRQDLPMKTPKRANRLKGFKDKELMGIPWMLAFALRADGWHLRQDIIWNKPNPMPESVRDRCTKSHEYIFLMTKQRDYYYNNEAIKEPVKKDWGTRDRTNGKYHNPGTGLQPHSGLTKSYTKKNKRSVWTVNKKPYKGAHFATFPEELIKPCILAGSEKGDIILDPFMGSGTTAVVAKDLGRDYIGCELHENYGNLIQKRIGERRGTLEDFL
jgi:DNA modification methylase